MKIHLVSLALVALLVAGLPQTTRAAPQQLARASGDQIPARLQAMTLAKSATSSLDRTPSATSWAIDPDAVLDAQPISFVRESREYWIDANAAELQRGLDLSTSAVGALVRLSPVAGNAGTIDPATLSFRANGKTYASSEAVRHVADQDALRAAGMDVPQGTLVLKLADALGIGKIELIVPTASGTYLVHVFEPQSSIVLKLKAERDTVIAGEAIAFRAIVEGPARLDGLRGLVSSPDGHSQAIDFVRQADGSFTASATPPASHAGSPGLWEVHAFGIAVNRTLSVQRDARSAFAVSVATARLDGSIERLADARKASDVKLRVGVESADSSRYQLAGVLYATTPDGHLRPVATAHSAAWLDAGRGTIDLRFDAESLAKSGAHAPFELRDLRLINQADMSLIERRERAIEVR